MNGIKALISNIQILLKPPIPIEGKLSFLKLQSQGGQRKMRCVCWLIGTAKKKEPIRWFVGNIRLRFLSIHPFQDGNRRLSRLLKLSRQEPKQSFTIIAPGEAGC